MLQSFQPFKGWKLFKAGSFLETYLIQNKTINYESNSP